MPTGKYSTNHGTVRFDNWHDVEHINADCYDDGAMVATSLVDSGPHPANTLVMEPGECRFADYLKLAILPLRPFSDYILFIAGILVTVDLIKIFPSDGYNALLLL